MPNSSSNNKPDATKASNNRVYDEVQSKKLQGSQLTSEQEISQGFLLTRQAQDRYGRICITLWLKTALGAVKLEILNELAVFFVSQPQQHEAIEILNGAAIRIEKVEVLSLKTFSQEPISGVYFKSMRDFYAARERLKHHNIKCYEDDLRPDDCFLMERFITANLTYIGTPKGKNTVANVIDKAGNKITDNAVSNVAKSYREYTQVKCKTLPFHQADQNIVLSMVSIDLECSMKGELYSIGLYVGGNKPYQCVLMIGDPEPTKLEYIQWVASEKDLLIALINWIQQHDPDIMIGWNVINFDFNLLQKRCDLHGIKFSIGRDGSTPIGERMQTANKNL